MIIQAQSVQQVSFAPALVRGIGVMANPFLWARALELRSLKKALEYSGRTLQFSSRNVIHRFNVNQFLRLNPASFSFKLILEIPNTIFQASKIVAGAGHSISPTHASLQSNSQVSLRRTNEREPEERFRVDLVRFDLGGLRDSFNRVTVHPVFETHALLDSIERNMIWRYCRGAGEDAPVILRKGETAKR